jgi:hypothetical protein
MVEGLKVAQVSSIGSGRERIGPQRHGGTEKREFLCGGAERFCVRRADWGGIEEEERRGLFATNEKYLSCWNVEICEGGLGWK